MGFLIFSIKNAFRGKLRFILTLALLVIGIAALDFSIGSYYFFGDLLQSSEEYNGGMNLGISSNNTQFNNTFSLDELNKVKSTNGVKEAVGVSGFSIFMEDYRNYKDSVESFTWGNLYAFIGESLSNNSDVPGIGHIKVIEGRLPTEGTQEVLITKIFAEFRDLKVGDNLNITAMNFHSDEDIDKHLLDPSKSKFLVVGIINNLRADVIMDLNVANELSYNSSTPKFQEICIKADPNQINQTKMILSGYDPYYDVGIVDHSNSGAGDLFRQMALFLVGMGVLIMLITSLKSISERTREIGVLKAIGWSNKRVMGMIFIETTTQALIAWVIALITLLIFLALESDLGLLIFFQANISTVIYFLIVTLLVSLLMPVIGIVIPLIRVTRLKPTEALRYE